MLPLARGLLAGAGFVALVDGSLRLGLTVEGFWREMAILACAGAAGVAVLLAAAISGAARVLGRAPFGSGAAFWMGAGAAAAPFASVLFRDEPMGLLATAALWAAAPWLGRRAVPPGAALAALAAGPLLLAAGLWFAPSFLVAAAEPPPLPAAAPVPGAALPRGPDLVLVSVDTLRADVVLEHAGALSTWTALRASGAWADYALSTSNQTGPAHATLLTGLPALAHGVRHNHDTFDAPVASLAERLRAAGWRTAAVVSNAVLRRGAGFGRGFEVYDDSYVAAQGAFLAFRRAVSKHTWIGWLVPDKRLHPWLGRHLVRFRQHEEPGELTRRTADAAVGYMRELQDGERPYFLFVHFLDPHHPYTPEASVRGLFESGDEGASGAYALPPGSDELLRRLQADLAAGRSEALPAVARQRALYLEELAFVDQALGRLVEQAHASGRPTVFLITSDHGEQFGEHGLMLHANSLYEPLVRVPFVLAGPGVAPQEFAEPPHLEDVVPTLLGLVGLEDPALPGRNLAAGAAPRRGHVESYFDRYVAVRADGWKLLLERRGAPLGGPSLEPRELYDLNVDPAESHDLLPERPDVVQKLLALAQEQLRTARLRATAPRLTEVEREQLGGLGYAEPAR